MAAGATAAATPSRASGSRAWVSVAISVLAVVAALGASVQVALIGDSGAKAAWSDVGSQSASSHTASK